MIKVSIKTNILMTLLLLVGIVSLSLLFSQHYFSKKLAIESTNKTFHIISTNISDHIHKEAVATRKILNVKSKHKNLLEPITFDPIHPFFDDLIQVLQRNSSLEALKEKQAQLHEDFAFIASSNIGGEFMDESQQYRVKEIAKITWQRHFDDSLGLGPIEMLRYKDNKNEVLPVTEMLLSDKAHHIVARENFDHEAYKEEGFKLVVPEHLYNYGEVYNLCIDKGTLSEEERYKINEHVIMSIKMLEKIPFPSHLTKIPEYAGTHHETLMGTGYPRKLTKDELSIPARIMAIADIFEALTASDRPYKKAKTLSEAIKIMSFMVKDQHIDEDLFKLFLSSGVYTAYAQKYLQTEQIDEVDTAHYLSRSKS